MIDPNCTICDGSGLKVTRGSNEMRVDMTTCPVCFPPVVSQPKAQKVIPFAVGAIVIRKRNFAVGQVVEINKRSGRIRVCWFGENRNRLGSETGDMYTRCLASAVVEASQERIQAEISKYPANWQRYYTNLLARKLGMHIEVTTDGATK